MPAFLTVCETCAFAPGEKCRDGMSGGEILAGLIETLAADLPQLQVRRHACLFGCERHCNVALSGPGKSTYVMGRFAPDREAAEAILGFARAYADSSTGQVPYRTWPEGVKGHMVARIPALPEEAA